MDSHYILTRLCPRFQPDVSAREQSGRSGVNFHAMSAARFLQLTDVLQIYSLNYRTPEDCGAACIGSLCHRADQQSIVDDRD